VRLSRSDDAVAALAREIKVNQRRQAKLVALAVRVQACAEEAAVPAAVRHCMNQAFATAAEANSRSPTELSKPSIHVE
jgi:hypothetical protein